VGVERGQVWKVDLGIPRGSSPALVRPGVVVSADEYNRSAIRTVTVAAITSNMRLASSPGNVLLPANTCGLAIDSVANVTQLATPDRSDLLEHLGTLPAWLMAQVDAGLHKALAL
jgi:mRNA interferase MazF